MSETYEILALKYATHANRTRFDNFMSAEQAVDYGMIDKVLTSRA